MPLIQPHEPYCLLEDGKSGLLFTQAKRTIKTHTVADVCAALDEVDAAAKDGFYAVGYLRYEAGATFHSTLRPANGDQGPLVNFAIFQSAQSMNTVDLDRFWQEKVLAAPVCSSPKVRAHLSEADYTKSAQRVLEHLAAGDIYQANLTFPLDLDVSGHAEALYARLRRNQPAAYSAFLATGDDVVLSLSPERFFTVTGNVIEAQPMKGTAAADDPGAGDALRSDPKNRAENLMITDLLRNDLSRVAQQASVDVPALFEVERLPSLYQMTSRVTAKLRPGIGLAKLMAALFPCGSVTGAPKLSAMNIIKSLETGPRGIYCGAIGMVKPNGDMTFNVPIRTIVDTGGRTSMSIGSGVVADSTARDEYRECLLKADFLDAQRPNFSLIETMRWEGGNALPLYWNLHQDRLKKTAAYFAFPAPTSDMEREIAAFLGMLPDTSHKVRLLYSKQGAISLSAAPIGARRSKPLAVRMGVIDPNTPAEFLRYKTTCRWPYSKALAAAREVGACDEVFLCLADGTLTEGSFTNIFAEKDGIVRTPNETGGFLPGILRAHLLQTGKVRRAHLTVDDLRCADKIYAGNAVRGLTAVTLLGL